MCLKMEKIRKNLTEALCLIENYDWLLSSNILDFYVNDDWNKKLPLSWRSFLDLSSFEPEELFKLISDHEIPSKKVWPLSLLSLKTVLDKLNVPRNLTDMNESSPTITNHPKLKQVFTKHVKPKKRHEVERMSKNCGKLAKKLGVEFIVDFGAGLGHLSRVLAYGYGLKVCCLEQNAELTQQAGKIDLQLEGTVLKYLPSEKVTRPVHLNIKLTKTTRPEEFIKSLKSSFKIKETSKFTFGIVGLHPCGDLSAILLKMFLSCEEARFINLVGCCHMKLTSEGYPLSKFLKNVENSNLSYEAREISCHALENYSERLINLDYSYLRIHSYRAVLEKLIVERNPDLKHSGLKSVKYQSGLTFSDYVARTCENLKIEISEEDLTSVFVRGTVEKWKSVVVFYTLRLLLAPLVESVLMNDRLLYLMEEDCLCDIQPIFDPAVSARNLVIDAVKL